mmetsp:Transcript_11360/g.22495  ORF Transcript_11360/g.22495 Transcript_11360/m.22495 type:complete len:179 (-) Transcript_11360:176-712(-)|eukprot:CAMPEP_0194343078 /NCGR_PEP_ID=MMETSP0171-20130528/95096_1 /TAXON_ID=218684 /ORGANISM="Corethron pennatum, Strain L29A3" /LENGTH=178 /DNA_ID=CAMNT_0039109079 /DNA_START=92 /DNA_END=628 /DNA_ORIENTATION=-
MNLGAAKRLRRELLNLERSSVSNDEEDEFIPHLRPSSDASSILRWTAHIRGPPDTPYRQGVYALSIVCGTDYPLSPPTIKFDADSSPVGDAFSSPPPSGRIFHPNVHFLSGEICLDILRREWSPAWSLQSTCRAVVALLSDPDASSPLNCDAGNMIRAGDMLAYESVAAMYDEEGINV